MQFMDSINEQLKDLYIKKFSEGTPCFLQQLRERRRVKNKKEHPAYPLLLNINEENYHNADLRIMVFGQETNSWEHKVHSDIPINQSIDFVEQTVLTFMDHYSRFLNDKVNKKSKKSPFWNAHNKICKSLGDRNVEIVWNNIYKIGNELKNHNRPHSNIRQMENENFDVISNEIEILKPDVLIFFTGPDYDARVNKKFQINRTIEVSSTIPVRELAKFSLENKILSYRTYHPRYLQQKHKMDYLKFIINELKEI